MKLPPETTALCLPPSEGGGGWVVSSLPSLHVLATGGGEGGGLSLCREKREKGKGDTEKLSGNENPPAPTSTASPISPSSDLTEPFGDFFRRSIGRRLGKLAIISVANVG